MERRTFLATGATLACASSAGCIGGSGGTATDTEASVSYDHPGTLDATFVRSGEFPADEDPTDGYGPAFDDPPAAPDVDPSTFERLDVNGESVPLAPIGVVEDWYRRGEARFVDARGLDQYERRHVYGAVSSPANRGSAGGAIEAWPAGDRIVTYCRCPHHLSSIRAAGLLKGGHTEVYAIDEGFGAWIDRGHPMAGTAFAGGREHVSEWTLEGVVDPAHAGEYAWAAADRQYEAAPIGEDGRFALHLKFADVTAETPIEVATPAYSVRRPLGELAAGTIDGR